MRSFQLAYDQLIDACKAKAEEALKENDPKKLRKVADEIRDLELDIRNKLSGLQGKLNAQASGR